MQYTSRSNGDGKYIIYQRAITTYHVAIFALWRQWQEPWLPTRNLNPGPPIFKGGLVRPVLEYGRWVWDHKLGMAFTLLKNVKMATIADILSFISRSKYNIHFKDALVFTS